MADAEWFQRALEAPLERTELGALGVKYEGKVRDCYVTRDARRFLVTTDRISAFDRVLGTLPLKGQLLQWVSAFWFEHTRALAPNHVLSVPDPNVMEVVECRPLGAEMVVRAYITGVTGTSMWTHYASGARTFCGHALPDGLKKDQRLARPLLTPSSKAPKGHHDVSMSKDELVREGHLSGDEFEEAEALVMALFEAGQRHCAARGLILADTKYELGRDRDGRLVVIDELHTPDSSRFWLADSYEERFARGEAPESFDKEFVRRWLAERGFTGEGAVPVIPDDVKVEAMRRYAEACEAIVGAPFAPELSDPHSRIRSNLGIA
ncbi:MAG: phosphoribosylaminoimidazolesuccinocarboxamide synthase [Deltaproteobacteria bacterium]|nr:phosphoribosylaminoimidazolesuccinocarboxamide synthase [Deltaproteobacteria bacterium]